VLIEDNEEIRNSLSHLLRSWGAEVIADPASRPLAAELGGQRRVDLILADQNLGDATSPPASRWRCSGSASGRAAGAGGHADRGGRGEVIGEFQRAVQRTLQEHPALAGVIARSRVEEPVVLQKPITTDPAQ
jgi:hypothetical protein